MSLLALWEAKYEEPIYLVTNLSELKGAIRLYRKRAHIETFFSDQKSCGFNIHKRHLSAPARLMRWLIVSSLAYIWLVYLEVCAVRDGWLKRLHRKERCDVNLFRLGVRLLARCLKDDIPIPEGLLVPALHAAPPIAHTSRLIRTHFSYGSERRAWLLGGYRGYPGGLR